MAKAKKCSQHPKYQGLRKPRSGCPECLAIYEKINPNPVIEVEIDRIKDEHSAEMKSMKKKYEHLWNQYKEARLALDTVKLMRENTRAIKIPPPRGFSAHSKSVAVIGAGDWHYEETVKPATVNGKNEFNLEIANKRIKCLFQNSLRLLRMFQQDVEIDTIVLALLGDFITNYLHEDNQETNQLPPMMALIQVQKLLEAGIRLFLEQTECDIKIPCVFGNHGRITSKKRSNNQSGTSLEFLMYLEMAANFAGEKRVQFDIAEGTHLYVPIFDKVVRFHHGDRIRYQGGIGGITIPANKAIAQWNRVIKADLDVFGHWHQLLDNGNFVINGSLIGYNAYALDIKASFETPQQVMFLMNNRIPQRIFAPVNLGTD
ncbi:MAG: hypothetical protein WC517_02490 [Patescibacteria group bacterium]